jgi:tetrahydromethanopterin S-methyltransferase subunit F
MLVLMKRNTTLKIGQLLLNVGGFAVGLVSALLGTLRELFVSAKAEPNQERRVHDSDFMGEFNHRTGRLDAGVDPYGWYDED